MISVTKVIPIVLLSHVFFLSKRKINSEGNKLIMIAFYSLCCPNYVNVLGHKNTRLLSLLKSELLEKKAWVNLISTNYSWSFQNARWRKTEYWFFSSFSSSQASVFNFSLPLGSLGSHVHTVTCISDFKIWSGSTHPTLSWHCPALLHEWIRDSHWRCNLLPTKRIVLINIRLDSLEHYVLKGPLLHLLFVCHGDSNG